MMSIFKCKMCGGNIEFEPGATVGVCEYCGTKQTLPRLNDDRRANLYDRANHLRRNNEFDKAAGLYEQILTEDPTDAEAYWSLVLCRYGIEYVEDPATHKRVPTVNRMQFTSIFDDDNYKSALQHADPLQKSLYEAEAAAINEIQKGILAISQKEKPFDVFICYKETDQNGRRTPDSVLANDLYHQLTQEGFKVFFARITLEDKLGTAYEPYIFAALNSAKVMVVLGTKPEYFNAVWVKNEWSRYLALVKASGGKKVLIPAFRDMDPYDLPEEFSHLQAQDMSKLGFMQDLIRGIKKIVGADEPKAAPVKETVVMGGTGNAAPLLRRAFLFLEDGDWAKADDFCEQVLNLEPENARAYLGKLMAELHVRKQEDLADCKEPFDTHRNFQKAMRFGDEKLVLALRGYIDHINERNENDRLTGIYNRALSAMNSADSDAAYRAAASAFQKISGFRDADEQTEQCLERAEVCRKNDIYFSARRQMEGENPGNYEAAIRIFETIPGWKDADEQISVCQRKLEELKAKKEAERLERERREEEARIAAEKKAEEERIAAEKAAKKREKVKGIVWAAILAGVAAFFLITKVLLPEMNYKKADGLLKDGQYEGAITAFTALNGYKDSAEKAAEIKPILLREAEVGSYVFFGSYEQDNNTSNGKEAIEWLVLVKENNRILVISKYALDCQRYNTSNASVTWETCSLRKWLNGTFLNAAFSAEEQAMIRSVSVSADKNPSYSTSPGNSTTDQVFLLSITEANKYFSSDEARKCAPTDYAVAQGAFTIDSYKVDGRAACFWWLRSPGGLSSFAATVLRDGSVSNDGGSVSIGTDAVRPALWINLGSV